MMIFGIGTDIIEISRIQRSLTEHGERFKNRIFTRNEQEYCDKFKEPAANYAVRFAAKEAVAKALGTGINGEVGWLDIEVSHDFNGKPLAVLNCAVLAKFGSCTFELSLSHCREYAIAFAVCYRDNRNEKQR